MKFMVGSVNEIKYIFLDEIYKNKIKQLKNTCYISYESDTEKLDRCINWNSIEIERNPLKALVEAADKILWSITVSKVFAREETDYLELDGNEIYAVAIQEIAPSEFLNITISKSMGNRDTRLLNDLINEAKKICNLKVAFVFPSSWSIRAKPKVKTFIDKLSKDINELLNHLQPDGKLKWVFLSLPVEDESTSPLFSLIGQLHKNMISTYGKNKGSWKTKSGTILLSGPTGSGKSYAARLLSSHQINQPFVEINLSSISESLLEARMKGYVKGAFTDANKEGRAGWFEDANNGVLFLDEFQSAPVTFQAQLLDLLSAVSDNIQVARIGDDSNRKSFKVKVVLAINENISALLQQNRLRKDILYRIRHIESFPSLSEKLKVDHENRYLRNLLSTYLWKSLEAVTFEDILEGKIEKILSYFPTFEKDALLELRRHEWEGNFRELERVAFDLFDEHKENPMSLITSEKVKNVIKYWESQITTSSLNSSLINKNDSEKAKLNDIQNALRYSDFIIKTALNGDYQSYYRSRPPLKKYLNKNKDLLDHDILNDSRMIKFMKNNV